MNTESIIPSSMNGKGIGQPPVISALDGARSSMSREFHHFLADIEDLIKETTSLTGEDLQRAKAKLMKRVASAKESVEQMGTEIAHRAQHTAEVTNSYVHERPWPVIGIGAAVGFVFGFLLTRRG